MISAIGISKNFGPHKVLSEVTFHVPAGKVIGFLGPNGAGKSTTMKILMGLLRPTSGAVTIDGMDVFKNALSVQKIVGYLPDIPPLYDDMTVREYLRFICEIKKVEKKLITSYIDEVIQKVRLGEVAHRVNFKLSKGYRQRVGLAQALVAKPKLVILDEPTSGFDPQQVSEFKSLIKSLAGQCTVLLSSHQLADVESICSEILVLNKGQLVAQGSVVEIQKKWKQRQQLKIQVDRPLPSWKGQLEQIPGVTAVQILHEGTVLLLDHSAQDITTEVLQSAIENGLRILSVDNQPNNLEDLFLGLTKKSEVQP